jgi:class 3 adenylate cyclase
MPGLPSGTVTFLLSDVEGSTALWEDAPEAMRTALARHDALFEGAVVGHGGVHIRPRGEGDSRFAAFSSAPDAVASAIVIQRALASEPWPTPRPIAVRIGIHTGEAQLREGDYYGSAVNRCARLRGIGHGGQILVSETTASLVRDDLPADASLVDLGEHRLRDLTRTERVYQLLAGGLVAEFPPLVSLDARPNNLPAQPTPLVG